MSQTLDQKRFFLIKFANLRLVKVDHFFLYFLLSFVLSASIRSLKQSRIN